MRPTARDRIRGSLLGGAVGDALGAPIEFMTLASIRKRFGNAGLTGYFQDFGRRGTITDDTQMSLFTAEGIIRAKVRGEQHGSCDIVGVIQHAYLRWLLTQGEEPATPPDMTVGTDGWLYGVKALHSRRAPGFTCLGSLRAASRIGDSTACRNDSKGCGGVMRVAPIGLFAQALGGGDEQVFQIASGAAAITHGHPSGYLAAGYLATTVAALLRGEALPRALTSADKVLATKSDHEEVAGAIEQARQLAAAGPTPERLEGLGGGWVAEEALAIAVCCALATGDFAKGVLMAVNHSGDSDSTGSIAGNLLGAEFGEASIPEVWLNELELCAEIGGMADYLDDIGSGRMATELARDAFPGW